MAPKCKLSIYLSACHAPKTENVIDYLVYKGEIPDDNEITRGWKIKISFYHHEEIALFIIFKIYTIRQVRKEGSD